MAKIRIWAERDSGHFVSADIFCVVRCYLCRIFGFVTYKEEESREQRVDGWESWDHVKLEYCLGELHGFKPRKNNFWNIVLYSHCCLRWRPPSCHVQTGLQKWPPGTCDPAVQRSGFRESTLTFPSVMLRTKLTLSHSTESCSALKLSDQDLVIFLSQWENNCIFYDWREDLCSFTGMLLKAVEFKKKKLQLKHQQSSFQYKCKSLVSGNAGKFSWIYGCFHTSWCSKLLCITFQFSSVRVHAMSSLTPKGRTVSCDTDLCCHWSIAVLAELYVSMTTSPKQRAVIHVIM